MSKFNAKDYWENRLRKCPGLHGVGYLGMGTGYNQWLYKVRRTVFVRKVKSLNLRLATMNILDIGSGTGFYIDRWEELGAKSITGLDLTSVAVERLRKRYPAHRICQLDIGEDLNEIKLGAFDIVSAFDVLFHVVDDEKYKKALENIYAALRPGGFFVFSEFFLHSESLKIAIHVMARSREKIEGLLSDIGFIICDRAPMFVVMNYPIDSRSKLLQRLWKIMARVVSIHNCFGFTIGAVLYPIEQLCAFLRKETPTTKMMVCRKPTGKGVEALVDAPTNGESHRV
jgi:SAM-dependent methyltransferase